MINVVTVTVIDYIIRTSYSHRKTLVRQVDKAWPCLDYERWSTSNVDMYANICPGIELRSAEKHP
jgi:hypothetical protein